MHIESLEGKQALLSDASTLEPESEPESSTPSDEPSVLVTLPVGAYVGSWLGEPEPEPEPVPVAGIADSSSMSWVEVPATKQDGVTKLTRTEKNTSDRYQEIITGTESENHK